MEKEATGNSELEIIDKSMEKFVGKYKLMSTALLCFRLDEAEARLDKAGFEFGKQRDRITALETYIHDELENLVKSKIEAAKTQLRGEMAK